MTSPGSPSPQAYKQESLHSQSVLLLPGPATQTDQTMAVLRSLLPHLGLFLCLALYFSPAFSASENASCVPFNNTFNSTSDNLEVSTKANVSDGKTVYTVTVRVNDSVSYVLLRAVNQNNNSVGTWGRNFENCTNAGVYNLTSSKNSVFETTWQPPSENVTEISLQVFIVINGTTTMKSEKFSQSKPSTVVTPTPPKTSGTNQTTTKITPMTTTNITAKTTTKITPMTTTNITAKTTTKITPMTTTKSLAISTLSSPLTGALHILLVFLVSKLLF